MWHTVMSIKGIDRPDALMPLGIRVEYLLTSPLSNVVVVWVEQLLCIVHLPMWCVGPC